MSAGPYSIGSDVWPGLSKLIEECGEGLQICGKLMGTGGNVEHWDRNRSLKARLEDELADLWAAMSFVAEHCDLDIERLTARSDGKRSTFEQWHTESKG